MTGDEALAVVVMIMAGNAPATTDPTLVDTLVRYTRQYTPPQWSAIMDLCVCLAIERREWPGGYGE